MLQKKIRCDELLVFVKKIAKSALRQDNSPHKSVITLQKNDFELFDFSPFSRFGAIRLLFISKATKLARKRFSTNMTITHMR